MSKYLTAKCFRSSVWETYHAPVPWAFMRHLEETIHNEMAPWVGAWVQTSMLRGWFIDVPSPVALGLEG